MICTWGYKEWKSYLEGNLDATIENTVNKHLLTCPTCLEAYTQAMLGEIDALEERHGKAPDLTQSVMEQIQPRKLSKRKTISVIHYGLAASIALMLLHFGIFDLLQDYIMVADKITEHSDQLIHQAVTTSEQRISSFAKLFILN